MIGGVRNPSYLAVHPSGATVYAVCEQDPGAVTAVRCAPDGTYEVIGGRPTGGAGTTHLSVHPSGRWLLSADYGSGSVSVHPIAGDGSLGERTDRITHSSPPPGPGQGGPHAHQIVTSPDGGHVLAVDLGTDTVYSYRLDEGAGTLTEVSRAALAPGSGPRHLAFHPGGRFAYLACELDDTMVVCAYDPATGALAPGPASPPARAPAPAIRPSRSSPGTGRTSTSPTGATTASPATPSRTRGRPCGCWTPCPSAVTGPASSPCPRTARCCSRPTSVPRP